MSTRVGYSNFQIGLHWLIGLLILLAWFTGEGMGAVLRHRISSGATGFEGNTLHVWLGTAVFGLVLLRIVVRLVGGAPEPHEALPDWHRRAAIWGHRLLYALMFLVPAAGATTWYLNLRATGDIHELLGNLFMFVAMGHALAAIYHQFRDGQTLMRMIRPGR
jgi:cytochrome b561